MLPLFTVYFNAPFNSPLRGSYTTPKKILQEFQVIF